MVYVDDRVQDIELHAQIVKNCTIKCSESLRCTMWWPSNTIRRWNSGDIITVHHQRRQ